MITIAETGLAGVRILESSVFRDSRGEFARLYCAEELQTVLQGRAPVQINLSLTRHARTVRGFHFQRPPHTEMKIVRCLRGRVLDVALDLRAGSPTFLRWAACELSPENARALIIPEGCAHGFQALTADCQLLYLHTEFYTPQAEGGVRYDDPRVAMQWPLQPEGLSERDLGFSYLASDFQGLSL